MDFGLTETQEMIRDSAAGFLAERSQPSFIRAMADDERGFTDEFWRDVADLGWLGLAVPESYGGAGMTFAEQALLLEEWGAALAPGPLFESAVLGAAALDRFGSEQQKRELLPQIAAGDAIVSPAFHEEHAAWNSAAVRMQAVRTAGGWALTGSKRFVPYGSSASHLIVAAQTGDGLSAFIAPRAAMGQPDVTRMRSSSGAPMHSMDFNELELPSSALLGEPGQGWDIMQLLLQRAAVGRAVQMAGLGREVLRRTMAYVSERRQFDQPVGAFQAVQHHCANMAVDVRSVRHLAYQAAWHIALGQPAGKEAARAKLAANEQITRVCWTAHQCHGAIGFTWEHDLHLFTRRALAWRAEYGDNAYHRGALADELLGSA